MNIIQQITRSNLYWQARRICYEKELPPEHLESVLFDLVNREFLRQAKPFIDMAVSVASLNTGVVLHFKDGVVADIQHHYSPEQQEVMDSCDQHIVCIAQRLGEAMGMDLMLPLSGENHPLPGHRLNTAAHPQRRP